MKNLNLVSLMDRFHSDERCVDLLESLRWPSGPACLKCGDTEVDPVRRGRGLWMCRAATTNLA